MKQRGQQSTFPCQGRGGTVEYARRSASKVIWRRSKEKEDQLARSCGEEVKKRK